MTRIGHHKSPKGHTKSPSSSDLIGAAIPGPYKVDESKESKYKCSECDFQTLYRFALTRHMRIHTGEFFRCHLCTCHFSDSYGLQQHLKGHAGKLRCKICGRNFTNSGALRWHEKNHFQNTITMPYD